MAWKSALAIGIPSRSEARNVYTSRSHRHHPCALAKEDVAAEPPAAELVVAKRVLGPKQAGENLLRPGDWRPYEQGFQRQGDWFVCDNGADARARRGVSPERHARARPARSRSSPRVGAGPRRSAAARIPTTRFISIWSTPTARRSGGRWRASAPPRTTGSAARSWCFPEKPVKQLSFYMLLRGHAGKAWFRDAELRTCPPAGRRLACSTACRSCPAARPAKGFQLRDVAAGSDFVYFTDPEATADSPTSAHRKKSSGSSCRRRA